MSNDYQKKLFIKEMFPMCKDKEIDNYIKEGYDLNKIVSILSADPINIEMTPEEYLYNVNRTYKTTTKYRTTTPKLNYPELWNDSYVDTKIDVNIFRERANDEFKKAAECINKIDLKLLSGDYYTEEAEKYREKGRKLNRTASLAILSKMLFECPKNEIDLHGLYVKEAIDFLNDYIINRNDHFTVITGGEFNSTKIRPAVLKFLKSKNFIFTENGAVINVLGKNI